MGKKNIRKDIKEFRQKLGFKTRDLLMGNIEEYCNKDKDIKKPINEKTIQRMENDFFATDLTLKVYAAALKVQPDQLLEENHKSFRFKKEDEVTSTNSFVKKILTNKDLMEITQNSKKRKFIMDFNEDNSNYGQNEGIKQAIEFIDKCTLTNKVNITSLIKDDEFGNQEKNKKNKDYNFCLNQTIKNLESGNEWMSWEEVENATIDSFDTWGPETDAEKMMWGITKESKKKYPIYVFGAKIFFDTFWPFEKNYFEKNIKEKGLFVYDIFDPNIQNRIEASGDLIYDPQGINNYILLPVRLNYSIIIFSSNPNIHSINIKNNISSVVSADLINDGNEKILYKEFNSTFDEVIQDISNNHFYPKNYLDEADINIIYSKDEFVSDPDDFQSVIKESSEKCLERILSDSKFYNYVKFLNSKIKILNRFSLEDNIDYSSREKWLVKHNNYNLLLESIEQIFGYYWNGHNGKEANQTIDKVTNIFLEAGDELSKELIKTEQLTEIP